MEKMQLSRDQYYDKVFGCWLGKNAGGVLGTPLEKGFGEEKMFDVWWYPKLDPGGMPNDDLEVQLVFFQALKENGLDITAKDLAKAWLKCIHYNYDEYGLHKTNLRKGLFPPISGWYNNWFKNCMGCPIRSEIWACLAPGAPDVAAHYAYEDAICDHAGGESVYGEIFNAVLESAAFFLNDRVLLTKFALSAIPEVSETAKAIKIALDCFEKNIDWKEARERVRLAVINPIAQYSPMNLGFQTIGLLYGTDFGDAICKAVNCGWDTDCTGATVGAIWGIIHGKSGLPQKWIEPLGEIITLSKAIKNLNVAPNLRLLTNEVCVMGEKILEKFGTDVQIFDIDMNKSGLQEEITQKSMLTRMESKINNINILWKRLPNQIDFCLSDIPLKLQMEYQDGPALLPNTPNRFKISLKNQGSSEFQGALQLLTPSNSIKNFNVTPNSIENIIIPINQKVSYEFSIKVSAEAMLTTNSVTIVISDSDKKPYTHQVINFVGSFRWLYSPVYCEKGASLKLKYPPEKDAKRSDQGSLWTPISWTENSLVIEQFFNKKPGLLYLRHFIHSPDKRKIKIGVPNNNEMTLWLNGKKKLNTRKIIPLRPNYDGDGANYIETQLRKGWNQVLVKIARNEKPIEAHFMISLSSDYHRGMEDIIECYLPWEN